MWQLEISRNYEGNDHQWRAMIAKRNNGVFLKMPLPVSIMKPFGNKSRHERKYLRLSVSQETKHFCSSNQNLSTSSNLNTTQCRIATTFARC